MTSIPSTTPAEELLRAENTELRERLAQAEDTLRAIRCGEVDALIVETADGPQVFTLQGLDAESSRFRGEMLAQISDSVIAVDADQRVTYLNAAAELQYGVRAATALGCKLTDLYECRWVRAQDEAQARTALRERGEWRGENIHVTRAGLELHVESCVTMIRADDGSPMGMIAIVRDITQRKLLDQLLHEKNADLERATAVAEKANRVKSEFLSNMSHELRTPLNGILGFAQLIESGATPPTACQKRSLDQILRAGWYLLELINELLDLAQIESGKIMFSLEPVSLAAVLSDCQTMVGPQAAQRAITITCAPLEAAYFIEADATRAAQVVINLLSNAIKYNRPGGAVNIACAVVAPDSIRISIQDTGYGMNAEQLAQLFQPFNRLGKEAGPVEGTGIGLVVTKRLIELMGGAIGVDGTVGVGSVFWIEFKRATAPQRATAHAEQQLLEPTQGAHGTRKRTLLYVEDNPANLELVAQCIARRSDLHMLSAADGDLGIEFARAHRPDVILMDINLPGINGIEAMKILGADPLTAHIPVIAVSANALPRDIEMCLALGFFDYLTKPIKLDEFVRSIDLALKLSVPNEANKTQIG